MVGIMRGGVAVASGIELIDITPDNVKDYGFCFCSDPDSAKFQNKLEWFLKNYPLGLRYRVLFSRQENSFVGMIEYIPGRHAWRGIRAENFMVIHCLMIKKEYSGKGLGSALIEGCLTEAKEAGLAGVAAVCTKKTWCTDTRIYRKNGFAVVDKVAPGLELVAHQITPGENPSFGNQKEKMEPYQEGVYMFFSAQCPFMSGGEKLFQRQEMLRNRFGVEARVIELKNPSEAQNNPCGWGTYGIIASGKVLNHVPGGARGFLQGLKKQKIIGDF